jgi:hypothetical protein
MNNLTDDFLSQPVRHLTNEQFDALLLSHTADHPHLRSCDECATQLADLRSSIAGLRTTSVAAADRHYRRAVAAQTSRQRSRLQPRLTWAATALAGVLFISLPFVAKFRPATAPPARPPAPATPVALHVADTSTVADISDDQLLSNIQSDLSASVPSPLLPLDSTSTSTTAVK